MHQATNGPIIRVVVAAAENGVIGNDNKLIWHLPADLKRFKELTLGFPIIMGRKTFESIGRALPGRRNIVITRDKNFTVEGVERVHSPEMALTVCGDEERVSIIGGGEIYRHFMPLAHELFITRVHENFEGDTYFPEPGEDWELFGSEAFEPDEKNKHAFTLLSYRRKRV